MIEIESSEISIVQQCRLWDVPRSSFYYRQRPINPENLELMKLIDAQYLKTPCWGSLSSLSSDFFMELIAWFF